MRPVMLLRFLTVLSCLLIVGTVHAGDVTIDEARFGATAIDVRVIGSEQPHYEYKRAGINAEVLLSPYDFDWREAPSNDLIRVLLTPRLHIGATVGLEENATSSLYTGFTWHLDLGQTFFLESSFGFAVHDGDMDRSVMANGKFKRGYGSPILFRESLAVGAALSEHLNIILQVSHMSHAELAGDENAGQTDVALKLGYKF